MVTVSSKSKSTSKKTVTKPLLSLCAASKNQCEAQEHLFFIQQCFPLSGREKEFQIAMNFLQQRWEQHLQQSPYHASTLHRTSTASPTCDAFAKSLFVFGACGSGKTSTIMRVLRMCSDRPIPGDPVGKAGSDNGNQKAPSRIVSPSSNRNSYARGGKVFSVSSKLEWLSPVEMKTLNDEKMESKSRCSLKTEMGKKRTRSSLECVTEKTSFLSPLSSSTGGDTSSSGQLLEATVRNEDECGLLEGDHAHGDPNLHSRSSTDSLSDAAGVISPSLSPRVSAARRSSTNSSASLEEWNNTEEARERESGLSATLHVSTEVKYWTTAYPHLTRRKIGHQRLLAHFVNCADLTGQQLVSSIVSSVRAACTSLDPSTRFLLESVEVLGVKSAKGSLGAQDTSCSLGGEGPLHVLALDEVEYARSSGSSVISELSMFAARYPHLLALIFISNQRYLVHAPKNLLCDLGFTAYTVSQLKVIAEAVIESSLKEVELMEKEKYSAMESTPFHSKSSSGCSRTETRILDPSVTKKGNMLSKGRSGPVTLPSPPSPLKQQITISSSLYEYIANKALSDYSGDARQVVAMCRRVVFSAVAQLQKAKESVSEPVAARARIEESKGKGRNTKKERVTAVSEQQLKAVVNNFTVEKVVGGHHRFKTTECTTSSLQGTVARHSGRFDGEPENEAAARTVDSETAAFSVSEEKEKKDGRSSARKTRNSSSTTAELPVPTTKQVENTVTPPSVSPAAPTAVTLASSIKLLRSCVVEEEAERYISTMTEQMAYVLACLVVLRLQQEEEARRSQFAIRGVASTSMGTASPAATVSSLVGGGYSRRVIPVSTKTFSHSVSMRALQNLYSTLMSCRHFPSMNMAGISSAVDSLGDLNIITRPRRRGTDLVFSFNGTWSIETIEVALTRRGEVLRKEMEACGLDKSENRFASVLWELKRIVGLM